MTKLTIKDVEYGYSPYGYANGMPCLAVYFGSEEGDKYDYEAPEVEGKTFTEEEIVAHGLMMDLLDKIKEKNLENKWSEFLLSRNWGFFVGSVVANPDVRKYSGPFFELIDRVALDVQRKVLKERVGLDETDEKMKAEIMKYIQPPKSQLVIEPKYFTGKEDFYQRFRTILCKYPLTEAEDDFNAMACVEIGNHNFAAVVFDVDDFNKQKDIIESKYMKINAVTVENARVYVVDHKGDLDVAKFAQEKGYRLNRALDYDGVVLNF